MISLFIFQMSDVVRGLQQLYQDYILNFYGVEAIVHFFLYYSNVLLTSNKVYALNSQFTKNYQQQDFEPYTVDGQVTGQFKDAGKSSYVRIYGGSGV